MSTLYVCKGGKLIPRDPEKNNESKPKVISYKHLIRQIPEIQCNCEQEKQRLIDHYENQLTQKDNQITILIHRIAQKETQIDKLQEQLSYLKNIQNTPAIKQEQNNNNTDDINWGEMNKSLNSTIVSSFSLCQWNETAQKIQRQEMKTEKQMDECFKKTNTLMSEIDNIMKKKRKYEFHNSILVENSIIEELQMSEQKSQQDTQQIEMQDTFCIPQSEYGDFDSLDMTTYESVQNFGDGNETDGSFYSKLLRDSIILKNTIIQMKQESEDQMNKIQAYYQKQLRISYEELEKQRQKNSLFEITKDKLAQIGQKGRQALAEIDQNEESSFYSNHKPIYTINRLSPQRENIQNNSLLT